MKRSQSRPETIDEAANRVTRSSSESEDIDLAAEATEGAPAKTLAPTTGTNNPARPKPRKGRAVR